MNRPLFAIAASSFSQPSETFIRNHARTIAPERTLIISQDNALVEGNCIEALTGVDFGAWREAPKGVPRAVWNLSRYWRRYACPALPALDRVRVVQFLKHHRPAALMAEYGPTGVMLAEAAQEAQTPLYVHFHGFDVSTIPRLPLWRNRYRRLFDQAAGFIGPSNFIANMIAALGCPQEKIHVCACGIDPNRFSVGNGLPGRFVAVGRLVEKKAPHLTIQAFSGVAESFPEAKLEIIGVGPLHKRCKRLIEQLKLEDRVILHGAQSHEFVAERIKEASVFVQHSVTTPLGDVEGMPVSILEAMASGLPVVATRHSGIQEAVVEGETGLLADEHDVAAMSQAMKELLEHPARAVTMGEAGRARVLANYTQQKSAEKLRAIMSLN